MGTPEGIGRFYWFGIIALTVFLSGVIGLIVWGAWSLL